MRKSLLGLVLVAAMLPVTVVHAAPADAAKAVAAKKAGKSNQQAIAEAVAAGATVQEAMAALLADNPADASNIVSAAVAAAPTQAGAIAAFAIQKGVAPTVAVAAATAAAPTQASAIQTAAVQAAPSQATAINQAINSALGQTANNNQQQGSGVFSNTSSVGTGISVGAGSTGSTGGGGGGGCGRATCS